MENPTQIKTFNIVLMEYYFSILCIRVMKLTFAIYGFYPLPQLLAEIAEVIESDLTLLPIIFERELLTTTPVALLSSLIRFSSSQNLSEDSLSELNRAIYSLHSFSM